MDTPPPALYDLAPVDLSGPYADPISSRDSTGRPSPGARDPSVLRQVAWEIGEKRPAEWFTPPGNHAGLAMVSPGQGFAHWRILHGWVEQTAWHKGDAWRDCRLVLRLYDVSYLEFNGLNAHRIQDHTLPGLCGHLFFKLPRPGTWQLGEVGFVLRNGEFLPAARSPVTAFAPTAPSGRSDQAALFVDQNRRRVEHVGNVWDQERVLRERRQPKLRGGLRIAAFACEALAAGHDSTLARFVTELAAGQCVHGHEVHVFVPAGERLPAPAQVDGVHYHALNVRRESAPLEQARAFARAAERRLQELPPFDLFHLHEWLTGFGGWIGTRPTVLSLGSLEATRRNGAEPTPLSLAIAQAEREVAHAADWVLTPAWLRDRAVKELGKDPGDVHAFPMEGRLLDEWECPLDLGHVKMGIGVGPLDRLLLFVGPLEHAAGVDLLVEALPVLLQRAPNVRLAFVGAGEMYGHLQHRAHQLGVGHAVRLLGHVGGGHLTQLLRAAEALVLPSRYRVPFDDAVAELGRRAGRPVVTTHGGPAHLVRHEDNGIVTYDNPGSMVWALDRILGDPAHAERMGQNGKRTHDSTPSWGEVARHYLELCAACSPELRAEE